MKEISPKRLAANRANAARSTGPRTPEGKARSSQNARKHPFFAGAFPVLPLEEVDEIARLRMDAMATYQPINSQETFALERIVLAQQAILRSERLHTGLLTSCLNPSGIGEDTVREAPLTHLHPIDASVQAQNRNILLAEGFSRLCAETRTFSLFLRYQAQQERLYRRAVEEFERLRKLRDELPDEPVESAQPEEIPELPLDETNPPDLPESQVASPIEPDPAFLPAPFLPQLAADSYPHTETVDSRCKLYRQ